MGERRQRVWYHGGLYHLSYQAYPYSLEGDSKRWGHATSTDMIHWTHWPPIMLDPGVNVPGDAWSGSTVVDKDNTSGLKTGANPVLVTLYTATSMGHASPSATISVSRGRATSTARPGTLFR